MECDKTEVLWNMIPCCLTATYVVSGEQSGLTVVVGKELLRSVANHLQASTVSYSIRTPCSRPFSWGYYNVGLNPVLYSSFVPTNHSPVSWKRISISRTMEKNACFITFFLAVHLSIILVNDQLEAKFFYFIIRLLQSSTCFEQRRAHHQEVKLY